MAGLDRAWSLRSFIRAPLSLAKIAAVAIVAIFTIRSYLPRIVAACNGELGDMVSATLGFLFGLGLRILIPLVALGLLDLLYQRWQFSQDMRISRRQLRDDFRQMEGDRRLAARQKTAARQLGSQRLWSEMLQVSVVVAGAQGSAVALRYDQTLAAPKVVGRGKGWMALRICRFARAHGLPVVEDSVLAAALYRTCQVGQLVPQKLYESSAEAIALGRAAGSSGAESIVGEVL